MSWRQFVKRLGATVGIKLDQHEFEPAISLRADDGVLGVLRCVKCGYWTYPKDAGGEHPPCVPRAHKWVPVKVFQWKTLPIANKLPRPLQCAVCGTYATTTKEWERLGCPGQRISSDPRSGVTSPSDPR